MTAVHFPAIKIGYSQGKSGLRLVLEIAQEDCPPEIASAALGTTYMIAAVETDRESGEPKASPDADGHPATATTGQQRGEAGKPQSDKPKQHWSKMLRSQRAGIRCSDLKFQLWMSKRYPRADCDTAELVRRFCNVKSRADLNEDRDAAERFDKLDAQFMMDTGRLAEVRS